MWAPNFVSLSLDSTPEAYLDEWFWAPTIARASTKKNHAEYTKTRPMKITSVFKVFRGDCKKWLSPILGS